MPDRWRLLGHENPELIMAIITTRTGEQHRLRLQPPTKQTKWLQRTGFLCQSIACAGERATVARRGPRDPSPPTSDGLQNAAGWHHARSNGSDGFGGFASRRCCRSEQAWPARHAMNRKAKSTIFMIHLVCFTLIEQCHSGNWSSCGKRG
jgi:hypothetical protein